ncbi:MAG: transcription termination factor NusA [Terracidiphilus sp.]|jgi:N utilization substance protein A
MSSVLYQTIELLSQEKGIEPAIVVGAVEEAIALATRKFYKTQENMRGELNKETGEIQAYIYKTVVPDDAEIEDPLNQITLTEAGELAPGVEVGSEIRLYRDTSPLGRIAAQLAKQVIFQKVREAERDTVFNEYAHREKEVLNATVKRIEGQDIIYDLGKAEAHCPRREQSRLEQFSIGERVRVVLLKVDRAAKGPQVVVSRAAPELVSNLFQSEVPEIYDGTVVIRAIAREAGERTKIAVQSRDKDVDPVGACVGMKGMRVQSIIRELRGEKIDIIEYSEEITTFAEKALQPAKVSRVSISDLTEKQLEVIVDDTQLSLAIGKKGQNVRLAAKLLGWKIDIKSEEEKRQEVEEQMQALSGGPTTPIEQVTELAAGVLQKLVTAGITTVEALADMTPEQLEEIPGIGEKTLEKISVAVRHYFGHFEEGEEGQAPQSDEGETIDAEHAEAEAAETAGGYSVQTAVEKGGEAEIENAPAVVADAEAEAENAAEVLEEAESVQAAGAEDEILSGAELEAEADAESEGLTAAELAIEDVPVADDSGTLETETGETESGNE